MPRIATTTRLRATNRDDTDRAADWRDRALCRSGIDPETFFPLNYSDANTAAARAICAQCPIVIKSECLEWALAHREAEGVWAGTVPQDRAKILAHRAAIAERFGTVAQVAEEAGRPSPPPPGPSPAEYERRRRVLTGAA